METPCVAPAPELDVEALGERGWFALDQFQGSAAALACLGEARTLYEAGAMAEAGIGGGARHRVRRTRRGDSIAWLDPLHAPPALSALWGRFEAIRDTLNREAYMGLDELEVQVACYPGDGTGYVRHRDSFPGKANRVVTAITYLNEGWTPEAGGVLRLYDAPGTVDIEPVMDRAVIFLSEQVEHEVLPAFAPRYAVTAWFRVRSPFKLTV